MKFYSVCGNMSYRPAHGVADASHDEKDKRTVKKTFRTIIWTDFSRKIIEKTLL
jgi:hypothetical protein